MILETYDDIFDVDTVNLIYQEVCSLPYRFGEYDNPDKHPTGAVCELGQGSFAFHTIMNMLPAIFPLDEYHLYRSYVNCFIHGENPFFHQDTSSSNDRTVLYYANPIVDYDIDLGGCTDFLDTENTRLVSVFPLGGRLSIFDSSIYHRADSFRTGFRFTIAFKFSGKNQ